MHKKTGAHIVTAESVQILALSVVAVLCVCPFYSIINDGQITVKWILAGTAFLITVITLIIIDFIPHTERHWECTLTIAIPFLIASLVVSVYSVLQISGIVPVKNTDGFFVLAGFDNPAGVVSALTVSFPFVTVLVDKVKDDRNRVLVLVVISCITIMILAIARSRAGLLAWCTSIIMYVYSKVMNEKTQKIIVVFLLLSVMAAVVYMTFIKRGSNSGRALILGVCWYMFKDAPLFGHGLHGFRSQYMLYQANFLDQCTSNVLPMLADNTTHPLNEYALLAVNFGVIGIATLLIGIIMTIMHFFKNPSNESFVGIMAIAGIGVLSMFSYPFRYPLTLLGLLCALLLVYKDVLLNLNRTTMIIIRSITATISALCLCLIIIWVHYQIQWNKLSVVSDNGNDTKTVIEGYNSLYPKLKNDPYFLYNYAYVLSENGECEKAGNMATKSFDLMANYDTALLIADNAKEWGDVEVAEEYYRLASRMCPVRFMPLYGLFRLYNDNGRLEEMKEIGQLILSKHIKVNSPEIRMIRTQVRQAMINDL